MMMIVVDVLDPLPWVGPALFNTPPLRLAGVGVQGSPPSSPETWQNTRKKTRKNEEKQFLLASPGYSSQRLSYPAGQLDDQNKKKTCRQGGDDCVLVGVEVAAE